VVKETPHRSGCIFHGEQRNVRSIIGSIAVGCHAVFSIKWSIFAAYTAAETPSAQWAGQPPKLPIPVGIWTPM